MLKLMALPVASLLNVLIGIWVLMKAPRSLARNIFVIFTFTVSLIPLTILGLLTIPDMSRLAIQLGGIIATSLASTLLLHFMLVFPELAEKPLDKRHLLLYGSVLLACFPRYLEIHVENHSLVSRSVNFWFYFFVANVIVYVLWSCALGLKKYYTSRGVGRGQLQYLLFGCGLAAISVSMTNLVLPTIFHDTSFVGIGPLFFALIPLSAAAAILKYRFLDIPFILKKTFVYSLLVVAVSFLYVLGLSSLLGNDHSVPIARIGIISAFVVAGLDLIRRQIESITDRWFFRGRIDYPAEAARIGLELTAYSDRDAIARSLVGEIQKTFKLKSCGLALFAGRTKSFLICDDRESVFEAPWPALSEPDGFPPHMDFLRSDRMPEKAACQGTLTVLNRLSQLYGFEGFLPVRSRDCVHGVFGIGVKLSGSAFHQTEIDALIDIMHRTALALEANLQYQGKLRIQQELKNAEKKAAIGELTRRLVHEIKSPLTSACTYFQFLPGQLRKKDETVLREQAAKSINRVLSLVGNLSKYNALAPVRYGPTDIRSLLEKELLMVRSQCLQQQIQCRLKCAALPAVRLDASVFRHAVSNVLQNSVESMPQGGLVNVTVTGSDGRAVIAFADTGCGIPSKLLTKVFDPMITTKGNGTGLGLAIAQKIVEEHGGTISIDSAPERGTVVTMELPLHP